MLDNQGKTHRLLALLKASLPFEVELTPRLVQHLKGQQIAIAGRIRHAVSDVSYAGDEGGIMCHIVPPDGGQALFVSLTQVRVPHSPQCMTLALATADYQKHRIKKLKKQGGT